MRWDVLKPENIRVGFFVNKIIHGLIVKLVCNRVVTLIAFFVKIVN